MSKFTEPLTDFRYNRFINAAKREGYKVFTNSYAQKARDVNGPLLGHIKLAKPR